MAAGKDLEKGKVLIHVESCDDASDKKESRTIQSHMKKSATECIERRRKSDVVRQTSINLLEPGKLKAKSKSIEREVDVEKSTSNVTRTTTTRSDDLQWKLQEERVERGKRDKNRQGCSNENIGGYYIYHHITQCFIYSFLL